MRDQVMEKVPRKPDFTELKSLANPPILVCNLLEIFIKLIYNQEPGWANAKVCLGSLASRECHRIHELRSVFDDPQKWQIDALRQFKSLGVTSA